MTQQQSSRFGLTLMSLMIAIVLCFVASPLLAQESDQESDEEQEREERRERSERQSGESKDLGSYRVGAPGSSRMRGIGRGSSDDDRPALDRESLRMDRSDFALEPAFGSSGGEMQIDMDIRPSTEDRQDRRVVDEKPNEEERRAARANVQNQAVQPVLIEAPRYPGRAHRSGIEGFAIVEFVVDSNGRTRDVRVLESSPGDVFDASARRAVERWQFEPRIVNGRAVSTRMTETIDFTLDD